MGMSAVVCGMPIFFAFFAQDNLHIVEVNIASSFSSTDFYGIFYMEQTVSEALINSVMAQEAFVRKVARILLILCV